MTNKSKYHTLSRKALQGKLVYGDIPKIEKLTGFERSTIYRWFDNENNHEDIHEGIINYLEAKDAAKAKRLEELKNEV